jgi:hypothetical protein
VTLRELTDLGVGFVSLTEALDLTTPTGRAMAGILAVFPEFEREVFRERGRVSGPRDHRPGEVHAGQEAVDPAANLTKYPSISPPLGDGVLSGPLKLARQKLDVIPYGRSLGQAAIFSFGDCKATDWSASD